MHLLIKLATGLKHIYSALSYGMMIAAVIAAANKARKKDK